MTFWPHLDAQCGIGLIVLLDQCNCIRGKAAGSGDYVDIDARGFPQPHLLFKNSDFSRTDTFRLPMFTLNNHPMSQSATKRVRVYAVDRYIPASIWCIGSH